MNQAPPTSSNSGCLPWVGLILTSFYLIFLAWRPDPLPFIDEGIAALIWWQCFKIIKKQFSFMSQFTGQFKQHQPPADDQPTSFKDSGAQGQIIDVEAEEPEKD